MPVTVYIIGCNEEATLRELLPTLTWADEILYVDSFSADDTAKFCAEAKVRQMNLPFEGFGNQHELPPICDVAKTKTCSLSPLIFFAHRDDFSSNRAR
jgi:glycosyltransferase involved in cell wall biosynthesis